MLTRERYRDGLHYELICPGDGVPKLQTVAVCPIAAATGTKQSGIQHAVSDPEALLSDIKHRRFAAEQPSLNSMMPQTNLNLLVYARVGVNWDPWKLI